MHSLLREIFDKTIDCFKEDPRVVAAYMSGSAFTEREDEFSDVDPVFFIENDNFIEFDKELPAFFRDLCDEVILFWPERFNCETWKNYAVIFRQESQILQYDITIEPVPKDSKCILPEQLLFDKINILQIQPEASLVSDPSEKEIKHVIDTYWVWAYIQAKYIRRKDSAKLIYVQQELFNAHLRLLTYCHDDLRPLNWWPLAIHSLKDSQKRDLMMSYLTCQHTASMTTHIKRQVDAFIKDTEICCRKYNLSYLTNISSVYDHLIQSL